MAHLVVYDGVCGLCNRAVRFMLRHDSQKRLLFVSMQSNVGRKILEGHGYSPDDLDTFVLIVDYSTASERVLSRSNAALFVMRELGGWCRLISALGVLPTTVRDLFYRVIARNRYGWFGRYDTCHLPEQRHRKRFLDL